jgi:endonuclease/exonuclease/phosphatase (EEP) superfamily protein YafD
MRRTVGALDLLILAYPAGLFALRLARWLWADQAWWIALANAFSIWLFAPAPVVLAVALLRRRPLLLAVAALPVLLAAALYAPRFLDRPAAAAAAGPTLTIFTLNCYGFNDRPEGVVEVLRSTRPDVVALQELNADVAVTLERELGAEYPYRSLQPRYGFDGMGVISRLPLAEGSGVAILPSWGLWLQQSTLDWHGQRVELLNAHAQPVTVREGDSPFSSLEWSFRTQERQTRDLLAYAADQPGPLVIAGDFNHGEDNVTAAWMSAAFGDSFLEAGRGLGHTFPMPGQGGGYGMPLGIPLTLRLDYVYHSRDLRAVWAAVGPWDRRSDHLPVLATLTRAT